jgi:NTE family protein
MSSHASRSGDRPRTAPARLPEARRTALADLSNRRVGLVLGAGGSTGIAYHAGTLLALGNDFGWDPRTADVIVGTSAGSVVATLLRGGLDVDDLAAWSASVPPLPAGVQRRATLDDAEAVRPRLVRPRWSSANWAGSRPMRRPVAIRSLGVSMLPRGFVDARAALAALAALHEGRWPSAALWINAVRRADGRRVVFGRDATAPLGDAVAASCAIPGLFTPVRIGGASYVDGGAHSPTNADVLRTANVDTVIVLSPMSARPRALQRRADHLTRLMYGRRLRAECRRLRAEGIDVHIFEPDDATLQVMGRNALDRRRTRSVVREAFLAATA